MTTPEQYDRNITFINLFTVLPEKQNSAAAKIAEFYQAFVRNQPGFVEAEIHKSLDSTTVAPTANGRSLAALTAMQSDLQLQNLVKIVHREIIYATPQIYQATALIN